MSERPDSYDTLGGVGRDEQRIQRSRFLAEAWPAADQAAEATMGITEDPPQSPEDLLPFSLLDVKTMGFSLVPTA